MRSAIRWLGLLALGISAVAAFVYYTPKPVTSNYSLPSASQYETLISTALSDDVLNNTTTQGAPQQAVVNGWTARDLLTIIAKENADVLRAQGAVVDVTGNLQTQPFDQRIPALLLIGILAVWWLGVSAPRPTPSPGNTPKTGIVQGATFASTPIPAGESLSDRLVQLEHARSTRLITDDEYAARRMEIISERLRP